MNREHAKASLSYGAVVIASLIILTIVMQLWRADLRVPFTYFGDALLTSVATKGAIENGWWWHNPLLGAPGSMNYGAYPAMDNAHFVLIKIISLVTKDYASALNLFFLLTFPLTTVTSLFSLRRLNVSLPVASFASLLFAFLPFHFFRSYHLFVGTYYQLPLIVLVILWICRGRSFLVERSGRGLKLHLRNRVAIFSLLVAMFIGACGLYYPFFSCFFLLVAGCTASLITRSVLPLTRASLMAFVIAVVLLLNLLPLLRYQHAHGTASTGTRSAADAEIMGLKIAQLLLPIGGHRIMALRELKHRYNLGPLVNENDTASLGLFASFGFLVLLARLFYKNRDAPVLDYLSWLNLAAILLATIGGFGVLFALIISPQIRAYNRISVFIAFFSLTAVALVLDRWYRQVNRRAVRFAIVVLLVMAVAAGVYDQTSITFFFVPEYEKIRDEYRADAEFVRQIESTVPAGAMVFQLPYVRFPENPPINKMTQDHEHFKAYLHSATLRWSYGSVSGEPADVWQQTISTAPAASLVSELRQVGFSGIYLNRDGYSDNGAALEQELTQILGRPPIVNRAGNLLFFRL